MKLRQSVGAIALCCCFWGIGYGQASSPSALIYYSHDDDEPILGDVVRLVPCTTIDLAADSRGFSTCAKEALVRSQITPLPDADSTGKQNNLYHAFQNLAGCSSEWSGTAMIIGHGESGGVRVGGGDYAIGDNLKNTMYIADLRSSGSLPPFNLSQWNGLAGGIKGKFGTIVLLGCETGASPFGSSIVSDVSSATASRVQAPTSKVWCDDNYQLRLEQDAGWTEANNGNVKLGSSPRLNANLQVGRSDVVKFAVNELSIYDTFQPSSIQEIHRCVYNTPYHPRSGSDCRQVFEKVQFLTSILFDKPLQPHAVPNTEITGLVTIKACSGEGSIAQCQTRDFYVLNDDMLGDTETRTFYYVTNAFKNNWPDFR